eukprot:gene25750-11416_t
MKHVSATSRAPALNNRQLATSSTPRNFILQDPRRRITVECASASDGAQNNSDDLASMKQQMATLMNIVDMQQRQNSEMKEQMQMLINMQLAAARSGAGAGMAATEPAVREGASSEVTGGGAADMSSTVNTGGVSGIGIDATPGGSGGSEIVTAPNVATLSSEPPLVNHVVEAQVLEEDKPVPVQTGNLDDILAQSGESSSKDKMQEINEGNAQLVAMLKQKGMAIPGSLLENLPLAPAIKAPSVELKVEPKVEPKMEPKVEPKVEPNVKRSTGTSSTQANRPEWSAGKTKVTRGSKAGSATTQASGATQEATKERAPRRKQDHAEEILACSSWKDIEKLLQRRQARMDAPDIVNMLVALNKIVGNRCDQDLVLTGPGGEGSSRGSPSPAQTLALELMNLVQLQLRWLSPTLLCQAVHAAAELGVVPSQVWLMQVLTASQRNMRRMTLAEQAMLACGLATLTARPRPFWMDLFYNETSRHLKGLTSSFQQAAAAAAALASPASSPAVDVASASGSGSVTGSETPVDPTTDEWTVLASVSGSGSVTGSETQADPTTDKWTVLGHLSTAVAMLSDCQAPHADWLQLMSTAAADLAARSEGGGGADGSASGAGDESGEGASNAEDADSVDAPPIQAMGCIVYLINAQKLGLSVSPGWAQDLLERCARGGGLRACPPSLLAELAGLMAELGVSPNQEFAQAFADALYPKVRNMEPSQVSACYLFLTSSSHSFSAHLLNRLATCMTNEAALARITIPEAVQLLKELGTLEKAAESGRVDVLQEALVHLGLGQRHGRRLNLAEWMPSKWLWRTLGWGSAMTVQYRRNLCKYTPSTCNNTPLLQIGPSPVSPLDVKTLLGAFVAMGKAPKASFMSALYRELNSQVPAVRPTTFIAIAGHMAALDSQLDSEFLELYLSHLNSQSYNLPEVRGTASSHSCAIFHVLGVLVQKPRPAVLGPLLAQLVLSCREGGLAPHELVHLLATAAQLELSQEDSQGTRPREVVGAILTALQDQMNNFSMDVLAGIASNLSTLGPEAAGVALSNWANQFLSQSQSCIPSASMSSLVLLLSTLPAVLATSSSPGPDQADLQSNAGVQNGSPGLVLGSFESNSMLPPWFMEEYMIHLESEIHHMNAGAQNGSSGLILGSNDSNSMLPPGFMEEYMSRLESEIHHMDVSAMAGVFEAVAASGKQPALTLMSIMAEAALGQLRSCEAADAGRFACGLVACGCVPSATWIGDFQAALLPMIPKTSTSALTDLAWAVSKLTAATPGGRVSPSWALAVADRVERKLVAQRTHQFNPSLYDEEDPLLLPDMARLIWALAAMEMAEDGAGPRPAHVNLCNVFIGVSLDRLSTLGKPELGIDVLFGLAWLCASPTSKWLNQWGTWVHDPVSMLGPQSFSRTVWALGALHSADPVSMLGPQSFSRTVWALGALHSAVGGTAPPPSQYMVAAFSSRLETLASHGASDDITSPSSATPASAEGNGNETGGNGDAAATAASVGLIAPESPMTPTQIVDAVVSLASWCQSSQGRRALESPLTALPAVIVSALPASTLQALAPSQLVEAIWAMAVIENTSPRASASHACTSWLQAATDCLALAPLGEEAMKLDFLSYFSARASIDDEAKPALDDLPEGAAPSGEVAGPDESGSDARSGSSPPAVAKAGDRLSSSAAVDAAWALGVLGAEVPKLILDTLCTRLTSRLDKIPSTQLSKFTMTLALSDYTLHEATRTALCRALNPNLASTCAVAELSDYVWAAAKLQLQLPPIFGALAFRRLLLGGGLTATQLSKVVWAMSAASNNNAASLQVEAFAKQVPAILDSASLADIKQLLSGFLSLGYQPSRELLTAVEAAIARLSSQQGAAVEAEVVSEASSLLHRWGSAVPSN